ncbi:MAG: 23S rRNA (adenine(2503)-C(2))-methyltransferase RlmN [Chlamydiales bacterium]
MVSKLPIFCHTQRSFAEAMLKALGKGERHAEKLYADWFRKGKVSCEAEWVEPQARALVQTMIELTDFTLPSLSRELTEGDAKKFLLKFVDGRESETVLIPMRAGITLCVSSQVGCKMGCAFCETAKMGLVRSLNSGEIVSQIFYAMHVMKKPVRNLVFMGMGEPFDNFDGVKEAICVLTDPAGLGFGPSRITVSTSGHVEGIQRFTQEMDPAINLAVSVNAPNDLIRRRLMPVNRRWDMRALKEALLSYSAHPRREVFAEYVLIKGINDSLEAADELASYLEGVRARVNLIPYNPQSRGVFLPPEEGVITCFAQKLRSRGYKTYLRTTKGQQIMAACGQLGTKSRLQVVS